MSDSWHSAEDGTTIGRQGSEQGLIERDEEHALGARITLERKTSGAPFAITCGIYGWMLHTRFFGDRAEAETQYEAMKNSLGELLLAAEKTAGEGEVLLGGIRRLRKSSLENAGDRKQFLFHLRFTKIVTQATMTIHIIPRTRTVFGVGIRSRER